MVHARAAGRYEMERSNSNDPFRHSSPADASNLHIFAPFDLSFGSSAPRTSPHFERELLSKEGHSQEAGVSGTSELCFW
jgi:hypothetical protein